ncbi:MAG: ATP-binding protein [Actinomycetes bacterium]
MRVQLVLALLLLSLFGLSVAGVAATTALSGYLLDQVDQRVNGTYQNVLPQLVRLFDDRDPLIQPEPLYLAVLDGDGVVQQSTRLDTALLGDPELPLLDADAVEGLQGPFTVPSEGTSGDWRVVAQPIEGGPAGPGASAGLTLVVGLSLEDVEETTRRLVALELLVGSGVLLVLGGLGYALVRRSLAPLTEIEHVARDIAAGDIVAGDVAAGDLSRRVPEPDERTEVGRLAGALNGMLARIERAVRDREAAADAAQQSEGRMRRFVADASHELRTPLTSIRGFAELWRQGAVPPGEEADRVMGRIESEARRMNVLVEDLLQLARLDQSQPLAVAPVDLVPLVVDAAYDARAVAPHRQIRVETGAPTRSGDAPHAVVLGDEVRLRQVLGNLLQNAITHTPAGTPVDVRMSTGPGEVVVSVVDRGPGLTEDQVERIFERFYRVDAARSRVAGGSGLGLAIVHAIVAVHGGRVEVVRTPGGGATFRVHLPAAAADPSPRTH